MKRIAAVVAAAGESRRMGQSKLRLDLGGVSILQRVIREISKAAFAEIVVVLGSDREALQESLAGMPVRISLNATFERGLGSSLRIGVDAVSADVDGVVIALADRPLVTAAMYEALIEAHLRTSAPIVAARFGGVVAPPIFFARPLFPEIGRDVPGSRSLVERRQSEATFVDLAPEALADVDTPEDYERLRRVVEDDS